MWTVFKRLKIIKNKLKKIYEYILLYICSNLIIINIS